MFFSDSGRRTSLRLLTWLGGCLAWSAAADGSASSSRYLSEIKPLLRDRCYACHGALKQKSGLRLDTATRLRAGADGGEKAIIEPGDGGTGELFRRLTSDDPDERMPPDAEPLTNGEVAAIRAWVDAGAPIPENEAEEEDPRDHWSFQPITRPAVPNGDGNPIDAFLGAKRAAQGLPAQPTEPERSLLIRRLYLDLIGLPPTAGQLRDSRPWEDIVDELLASPHHGERWARHWMDVWRYSDWYGLGAQLRYSQKHLWHWRDWIVESLNADKGYDRMIQEMLAADELAPGDPETVRATGFLARNYFLFNRTTWLDTTIEHTGKAFFGLTLNCAKCHDHKYDPIDQEDYYRFRALFEPHQVRLDPVPGVVDLEKNGLPRVFDNHPDAVTPFHVKGDPTRTDESVEIAPGVPLAFASFAPEIVPVSLPLAAHAPGSRDYAQRDRLAAAEETVRKAGAALAATATEPEAPATDFLLTDEFDRERPDLWEIIGEGWEYADGRLHQRRAGREPAMLRSREILPRDFEMTCRYTTTGGEVYRSVTFRFDLSVFDATASFDRLSLRSLPPDLELTDATDTTKTESGSIAQVESELAAARAELAALRATVTADRLRFSGKAFAAEGKEAARLQAEATRARAEADLLRHADGDAKKRKAAEERREKALATLAAIKKGEPRDYAPLRVSRKALETPAHTEANYPPNYPETSTGRRTMLARWITSPENPLTARVAANHVWMRHFGEPLVESVFDFGRQAPRPEHAELLDYLAREFIDSGWSFRHLHRLMVTSDAYRMTSSNAGADAATLAADPANRYYWRMNSRRMESQVVRDSLLHLADKLDPAVGGPSLDSAKGGFRRSLYFTHSPDSLDLFLTMFDEADLQQCYRRSESVVPQQALALANSALSLEMAAEIATRIEAGDLAAFIDAAFERVLGRLPDLSEKTECIAFADELAALAEEEKPDALRVRTRLVHALLNHNDFVTIR